MTSFKMSSTRRLRNTQGLKFPWHYIRDVRHSDNSYENVIFLSAWLRETVKPKN